jgi:plasmid stabilization system protein ParE
LGAVERLAELPNLGRPGRLAGTRELVVPSTKYLIPYRLRGDRGRREGAQRPLGQQGHRGLRARGAGVGVGRGGGLGKL